MLGEDHLNIKMQLIIGALKLAEFPDHISIDYASVYTVYCSILPVSLLIIFYIELCHVHQSVQQNVTNIVIMPAKKEEKRKGILSINAPNDIYGRNAIYYCLMCIFLKLKETVL